jgi:hypothetical protein
LIGYRDDRHAAASLLCIEQMSAESRDPEASKL